RLGVRQRGSRCGSGTERSGHAARADRAQRRGRVAQRRGGGRRLLVRTATPATRRPIGGIIGKTRIFVASAVACDTLCLLMYHLVNSCARRFGTDARHIGRRYAYSPQEEDMKPSIKRRQVLIGTGLFAATAALPVMAQDKPKLRFSAVFSDQDIRAQMMKKFAD